MNNTTTPTNPSLFPLGEDAQHMLAVMMLGFHGNPNASYDSARYVLGQVLNSAQFKAAVAPAEPVVPAPEPARLTTATPEGSERILEMASSWFVWNARSWQKATAGTVNMTNLLGYTEAIIAATRESDTSEEWRHAANEWADVATSGLQWLRNIEEGVTTDIKGARENTEAGCQHAMALADAVPRTSSDRPVSQQRPFIWIHPSDIDRDPLSEYAEHMLVHGSNVKFGSNTMPLYLDPFYDRTIPPPSAIPPGFSLVPTKASEAIRAVIANINSDSGEGWKEQDEHDYWAELLTAAGTTKPTHTPARPRRTYAEGVLAMAEEVSQLCSDYSSQTGSVYIGDVRGTITALAERLAFQPTAESRT